MAFPLVFSNLVSFSSINKNRASLIRTKPITQNHVSLRPISSDELGNPQIDPESTTVSSSSSCSCCGRRRFIESALVSTASLLVPSARASETDPTGVLKRESYALPMDSTLKAYEAEIAGYKAELFGNLKGKARRVLELGIGTGPNLRFYADDVNVTVFGVDPNREVERYARAAAAAAGMPPRNFKFIQAAGESIPLRDASVDAVVGTLVLCSVQDVDMTLKEVKRVLKPGGIYLFVEHVAAKDGTILRLVQSVLDPVQQIFGEGCHLTRETGKYISEAGFSSAELNTAFLSSVSVVSPHLYGIARK